MSSSLQPEATSSSTPNFQPIFEKALEEYKKKTGKDLTAHPLAAEIKCCDSPDAILTVLEGKANELNQSRDSDERLTKWLIPTVNILNALSATLGEGAGSVFPPTKIIFSGISILLVAAKSTLTNRDVLVELFSRIESFFERLRVITEVPPPPAVTDVLARNMAEVLSILSIATKGVKERRTKTIIKKLAGVNDIDDALQRLRKLEQGELLTVIAQMSRDTSGLKDDTKETKGMVMEIVNKMDTRELEQFLLDLRRWLSPPDPTTNYMLGLRAYHKGTAAWFIENTIFQDWYSTGSLMWIHGKPGSGKSILCSAIIQHVVSLCDGGMASMAYFYFDFRDDNKKHLHDLLPSLLFQFATYSIPCCDIISPIYSAHGNGTRPPSDGALMKCLMDMLSATTQHPIYIIMDALDECPNISGVRPPREHVLSLVKDLVNLRLPNLHICVTSRPEIDIRNRLEPLTSLRVSLHDQIGHKEDIAKYINSEVDFIANDKRWREDDKDLVIETLSEKADGMFRWVYCQLEVLRLCLRSRVRHFVNELPDSLDETYERVLKGIHKMNRSHVQRLLQCLVVAIRPLRVEELAEVLTSDPYAIEGKNPTHSRSEDQEQEVLSACPSLITVIDSKGSRVIQFSHFSVKEFLTSDRLAASSEDISHYHILPEAAHMTLSQASLGVLLRLEDRVDGWNARRIPLVEYAAKYWVSHSRVGNVSSHIMARMKTLFDPDKPHFAAWVRVYDIDEPIPPHLGRYVFGPPWWGTAEPLYYSAHCGFYGLVEYLVKKHPGHINAIGGKNDYPLVAALSQGHLQVAELLFQHGANVSAQGHDIRTPLHIAIGWTNDLAVGAAQFLLKHDADVNARNINHMTPLHLAAAREKFEVAQLLLQRGADVIFRNLGGETPLHLVAQSTSRWSEGHRSSLVQLLLDHGAEVNSRDNKDETALHNASLTWNFDVAQVLLNHGAYVNAENNQGQTPFHRLGLSKNNHYFGDIFHLADLVNVARLLLELGADVNTQDRAHKTPLHLASYDLCLDSALVLLDHGANVNAKDSRGQTPLHQVSQSQGLSHESHNHVLVARLLVERGADVNIQDEDNNTPLHLASCYLHPGLVRALLDLGANVNAKNSRGQTPLHQVSQSQQSNSGFEDSLYSVTQLLVERGADVNTPDDDHETPLHLASLRLGPKSVRVLLDHGANINAKNSHGQTPLHQAISSRDSYFGAAQLLVERDADVDARDNTHETPLHLACRESYFGLVQILLDRGADVHAENSQGQTPFHQVFQYEHNTEGRVCVARLLVEHGVDVNTRDKDNETPLHLASRKVNLELVWVLLEHSANVNAKDNQGMTPLHHVSQLASQSYYYQYHESHFRIAQLLLKHGADVNARDKDHNTPLHLASWYLGLDFLWELLDHGANVNAWDNGGRTPLHRALEYRDHYPYKNGFGVSQLLMERGADVNAANSDGETPLHLASRLVSLEVAWVLLRDGADLNVEDKEGKTPFQLVREKMREEMKCSPSEYPIGRARRAQGVALMGLLYGY